MSEYTIGVSKNRFELSEEEDPLEVLKLKEEEKEARRKAKILGKENKAKLSSPKEKSANKKVVKSPLNGESPQTAEKKSGPRVPSASSSPEFPERKAGARQNLLNRGEMTPDTGLGKDGKKEVRPSAVPDRTEDSPGGKAKGFGTPRALIFSRGGRRGGYELRRQRGSDRQSGTDKTDVKPTLKGDGSGDQKSNKDDVTDVQPVAKTESPQKEPIDSPKKDNETDNADCLVPPKELLTLDEWKASRGSRRKPVYNLRQAGEGEDLSQWTNMYELHKKKAETNEEDYDEDFDLCEYPQRVGRQKHVEGIKIHFADSRSLGRGGKGIRGGYRSPNSSFTQDMEKNSAPKVDDARDFPSLSPVSTH